MESIAQVPSLLPAAFSCSECLLGVSERWRCGGSVFSSVALLFFSLLSHRLLSCAWCAVRFVLRLLFLSSTCLFYKPSNVSTLGSRLYGGAHQLPFWGRRQRLLFKSHLVFRALTVLAVTFWFGRFVCVFFCFLSFCVRNNDGSSPSLLDIYALCASLHCSLSPPHTAATGGLILRARVVRSAAVSWCLPPCHMILFVWASFITPSRSFPPLSHCLSPRASS